MIVFKEGYYADVRTERRFSSMIAYKNGVLAENKERIVSGAFIRVFDGKRWFYASTESVDEIQKELDGLYELAEYNATISEHPVVKRFEVNKDKIDRFSACSVEKVKKADKQALITSAFNLFPKFPEIKLAVASYIDRRSEYTFFSSKGADIAYDYQTAGYRYGFFFADGDKNYSYGVSKGYTSFEEIDKEAMLKNVEDGIVEGIAFMKTAENVTPGDYPVVLAPIAAGVFAHESFGHKSESDFMLGDETMKKEWSLGKTVASPHLSILESGSFDGCGYVPYDDEGTKASKTYLIKDGVLSGRLHSAETAAALDEGVTGNARAMSTEFEPIVRMTTTVIEGKGDKDFDELIKPIKKGYFIKDISHGSGMSTFTIAPVLSYEIVNGKIGKPVKISVISGDVFETLGLIDGVTAKEEILSFVGGGCGKMEQNPLPVGFGAPYVSVSKMRVQ